MIGLPTLLLPVAALGMVGIRVPAIIAAAIAGAISGTIAFAFRYMLINVLSSWLADLGCLGAAFLVFAMFAIPIGSYVGGMLLLWPLLTSLIYKVVQLDFSSIIATASLIIGDIASIIGIYEFMQKRRERKRTGSAHSSK
jgi:hypothetical protein